MDVMAPYIAFGKELIEKGYGTPDRTAVGTRSLFGHTLRFDVTKGAPFLTHRKIPLMNVIGELLWFLEGSVDTDVLVDDYKCRFWGEWASDATRTIGPMYGKQWRDCDGVDQIDTLMKTAIATPTSRRMVVNVWIPKLIPGDVAPPKFNPENGLMSLAPCHFSYQLKIYPINESLNIVNLQFNLRSSDYFLGLPNNIASYYILLRLICAYLTKKTGIEHKADTLIAALGDVHIYNNHIDECEELFAREPSAVQPDYIVSPEVEAVFESYLNGIFEASEDKPLMRRTFVRVLYKAIKDYKPGEAIQGARNV